MLKIYKVEHSWNMWACTIEINEEFTMPNKIDPSRPYTTQMLMKEMILFWSEGEQKLNENDGDIAKTFLQQLAREILIIQTGNNRGVSFIIGEFKDREGWCDMDGSMGIKIRDVDDMDVYETDFTVEKDETA